MIKPQIGETMADFACGTGGFLSSWIKELEAIKDAKGSISNEDSEKLYNSIYAIEKKQFPYMLCVTNMLLHGIDNPKVFHDNSLTKKLLDYTKKDEKIDKFLTSKKTGMLVMILLFSLIFFITIKGANLPSELLSKFLFGVEKYIKFILRLLSIPPIIINALIDGVYKTLAWVISVMLPPMAIFFPLFALLEDSGYLPRISFNMDKLFQKCGTSGKQSLTMCMGCGCNACGVMGARIISNKKERLIAILTNVFMPCNGRFPTLITLIIIFITSNSIFSSLTLMVLIIISVFTTLLISKILSKLLNNKDKQTFILELPPYRKPSIIKIVTICAILRIWK